MDLEWGLRCAIFENDASKLEEVLNQGFNIDQPNHGGSTPIFVAIDRGAIDVGKVLIRRGCNVNYIRRDVETPLMCAVFKGSPLVEDLLVAGADPQLKVYNRSPFDCACMFNRKNEFELMLRYIDIENVKVNLLFLSLNLGLDTFKAVLDKGVNVNSEDGMLAMTSAIVTGPESVEMLFDYGFKPTGDHWKCSELSFTGRKTISTDALRILFSKADQMGIDININSSDGEFIPFTCSCLISYDKPNAVEVVSLLHENGGEIITAKTRNDPAWFYCRRLDVFEWILSNNLVDVNERTPDGDLPIFELINQRKSIGFIKTILNHGADPNSSHSLNSSYRIISHACHRGNIRAVQALIKAGATIPENWGDDIGRYTEFEVRERGYIRRKNIDKLTDLFTQVPTLRSRMLRLIRTNSGHDSLNIHPPSLWEI